MGGRRTRWGRLSAALLVASMLVSGVVGVGGRLAAAVEVPLCTRLGVIGDSLTVQSQPALEARLVADGITQYRIDAMGGRVINAKSRISTGVQALRRLRAAGYHMDCYVVALGTNDVIASRKTADYEKWIRAMLTEIGDFPVIWVGPAIRANLLPARNGWFNDTLAAVALEYPNVHVVDWRPFFVDQPGWFGKDGVHLTAAGKLGRGNWLADLVLSDLYGGVAPDPVPPDCTITKTLRRGTVDPQVLCLERRLAQIGYSLPTPPDDTFDTATYTAVKDVQRYYRRYQNGQVGKLTAQLLGIW